jgi:hypothetical protein
MKTVELFSKNLLITFINLRFILQPKIYLRISQGGEIIKISPLKRIKNIKRRQKYRKIFAIFTPPTQINLILTSRVDKLRSGKAQVDKKLNT